MRAGVVALVGSAAEVVGFAVVGEHPCGFVEAAEGEEELDALIPRDGVVGVVVEDEERGLDAVDLEDGRVVDEAEWVLPGRAADAALGLFVLELARAAGAPADAVVGGDHVDDGCAVFCGFEARGLGDHVGDLVAAPAVALDADVLFVDEAARGDGVDSAEDAFERALAGVAGGVDDVGREDEVAVRDVVADVDRVHGARVDEVVEVLRELLVEVDDHRIFFVRVEVFGLVEDALQGDAVGALEVDHLVGAPEERGLLRVGVGDFLQGFEGGVGDEEVGEFGEGLRGESVDVGVAGFDGVVVVVGGEEEFGGGFFGVDARGEEAGVAVDGVFGVEEDGFGGVDGSVVGVGVEGDGAELEMLRAAEAVGEVGGGAAVGGDLPDVVVIVEEDVLVVFGPLADAVGSVSARGVFFFVPEGDGEFGGEVDGFSGGDRRWRSSPCRRR